MQPELVACERAPESRLDIDALEDAGVHVRREELVVVPADGLRVVHRRVGVLQERGEFGAVLRVDRDADRGGDRKVHPVDREGFRDDFEHLPGDSRDVARLGDVLQQQDEFVAALPAHGVGRAHAAGEPSGHLLQELVAHLVTERIVDDLEAVEVEEQHRDPRCRPLGERQRLAHAVFQERAVRQARQEVVLREMVDAGFLRLALRDVVEDPDVVRHGARFVTHGAQPCPGGKHELIPAAQPQLALPASVVLRGDPEALEEVGIVATGLEHDREVPHDLVAAQACHRCERAVHGHDPAGLVHDHHRFLAALEDVGRQSQFVLGDLAVGDVEHHAVVDDLGIRDTTRPGDALPPACLAVRTLQSTLEVPDAARHPGLLDGVPPALEIVGMDERGRIGDLRLGQAEEFAEPRADPDEAAAAVGALHPLVRGAGQVRGEIAEPLLALAKQRFRARAFGDVEGREGRADHGPVAAAHGTEVDLVQLALHLRVAELDGGGEGFAGQRPRKQPAAAFGIG